MKIAAVILAAGSGTRLGGVAKALLPRGGRTFLETILGTAREAGVITATVVVGPPFGERVGAQARALGAGVVTNPEPSRGMASSVALGFAALGDAADAAWLWPVDHPDVTIETLRRIMRELGEHQACAPRFGGRGGHPPLITRALWPRLAACSGVDGGARTVIAAADVRWIDVDDPGVVRDVDVPGEAES